VIVLPTYTVAATVIRLGGKLVERVFVVKKEREKGKQRDLVHRRDYYNKLIENETRLVKIEQLSEYIESTHSIINSIRNSIQELKIEKIKLAAKLNCKGIPKEQRSVFLSAEEETSKTIRLMQDEINRLHLCLDEYRVEHYRIANNNRS
jgi:hypothetical protein